MTNFGKVFYQTFTRVFYIFFHFLRFPRFYFYLIVYYICFVPRNVYIFNLKMLQNALGGLVSPGPA